MANQLQILDVGVPIVLLVERRSTNAAEDQMGSATNLKMIFYPPSGVDFEKTATLYTDGSDGKIEYVTEADVIDEAGFWKVQASFTLGSFVGRTSIATFSVEENLS